MAGQRADQFIDLFDFTPGMYADFHAGLSGTSTGKSTKPQDGAATVENTWACVAEPGGALRPLPKRATSQTETAPLPLGAGYTSRYYTQEASFVLDALVQGPATKVGPYWFDYETTPEIVSVAHGFLMQDTGAGTTYVYSLVRSSHLYTAGPGTHDSYFQRSTSSPSYRVLPALNLEFARTDAHNAASYPPAADTDIRPVMIGMNSLVGYTGVAGGAMTANDKAYTTFDTTTYADGTLGNYPNNCGLFAFMDPSRIGTATASVRMASGLNTRSRYGQFLIMHQGRAVVPLTYLSTLSEYSTTAQGIDDSVYIATPYNVFNTTYEAVKNFVEENPTGYGTGASFNANTLVLVKNQGGGVLISGSMNSPQVRRLPMLESTYGAVSMPTVCPLGMVYGTRNGVYAWNNGDQSVKLSNQLDGFFWRHERKVSGSYNDQYSGSRGRFAWWDRFVVTPNDFLYDSTLNSWWRLDDTQTTGYLANAPHNVFRVSPAGKLYAFRYRLRDTAGTEPNNIVWDTYSQDTLATSYSWQSQPLVRTRERRISVQELHLTAQVGQGATGSSVAVTLTGVDEGGNALTPVTVTFDLSAAGTSYPVAKMADVAPNFQARYVQVKIVASTSTGPAPKILGLRVGFSERAIAR